ncbi:ABC transporter permease [Nakamurella aerolata]|uniref:ABC transporter permease n=1 Tax=Nakamurella aerolata TaxID=1656892 RepID=A0A849AIU2_9ACTN|nr:ABC transporter permease [Nakamurella aerolata]NNG36722.1 ABC transporter permease [Nakamurella aerolata]
MVKLLRRWLLTSIPLVLLVSVLTFVLAALVPGDAARAILGFNATEETYQNLRSTMGLDDPLPVRFWDWFTAALRGDLGTSITNGDTVSHQIAVRIGPTIALTVGAIVIATVVGVGLGLLSSWRGGWLGKVVDVVSLLAMAVPAYWFGLLLVWVLAIALPIFPATGYVSPGDDFVMWFQGLVLPWLTLGITASAPIAKQTRDGVLTELNKDYVTVLRSRGVPERTIVFKHVLRNAATPVVSILGLMFIGLLSGTVLVEALFVIPGVGGWAVEATQAHDIPAIQGIAVLLTLLVVAVNLVIEVLYGLLNPKVRT